MGISSFVAGIGLLIFPYINSLVSILYTCFHRKVYSLKYNRLNNAVLRSGINYYYNYYGSLFKIKFKATNCYHKIVKQIVYKNFFEGIDTNQIALFSNLILLICML